MTDKQKYFWSFTPLYLGIIMVIVWLFTSCAPTCRHAGLVDSMEQILNDTTMTDIDRYLKNDSLTDSEKVWLITGELQRQNEKTR